MKPSLYLGALRTLDGTHRAGNLNLPAHHLVTHCVTVGMTEIETLCSTSSSCENRLLSTAPPLRDGHPEAGAAIEVA
jgi:hypothetical protein